MHRSTTIGTHSVNEIISYIIDSGVGRTVNDHTEANQDDNEEEDESEQMNERMNGIHQIIKWNFIHISRTSSQPFE